MGNISVYHSLWKGGLTVAIQFGFAALGVYAFTHTHGFHRILAWLWTLTFTIAGILRLWLFLKERITRTPYYLITDDRIIVTPLTKKYEIHFADVQRFFLTKAGHQTMVGIEFIEDVELQKLEETGKAERAARRLNKKIIGSQEAISADALDIKPNDLCDILNERVKSVHR